MLLVHGIHQKAWNYWGLQNNFAFEAHKNRWIGQKDTAISYGKFAGAVESLSTGYLVDKIIEVKEPSLEVKKQKTHFWSVRRTECVFLTGFAAGGAAYSAISLTTGVKTMSTTCVIVHSIAFTVLALGAVIFARFAYLSYQQLKFWEKGSLDFCVQARKRMGELPKEARLLYALHQHLHRIVLSRDEVQDFWKAWCTHFVQTTLKSFLTIDADFLQRIFAVENPFNMNLTRELGVWGIDKVTTLGYLHSDLSGQYSSYLVAKGENKAKLFKALSEGLEQYRSLASEIVGSLNTSVR